MTEHAVALGAGEGETVWFLRNRTTVKIGGEQTGGAYGLVESLVPAGWSPPLHLHAGDATVHCAMTPHRAPANETSAPRWVYSVSVFPADTLYTGAPQAFTDGLGLAVNEPFDHPRFPLL